MVTELIPGDNLENFLRSKREEFSTNHEWSKYENVHFGLNDRQLLMIALQIASGMRHLEERKVGDAALYVSFFSGEQISLFGTILCPSREDQRPYANKWPSFVIISLK